MEPYFEQWSAFDYLVLLAETSISTIIILVFAEFLPKTVFRQNAEGLMKVLSVPAYLIFWVLRAPSALLLGVSQFFLKYIFRIEAEEESNDFGRVELDHYVRERVPNTVEGDDEVDPELEIFKNALEFPETKAREFMIPRTKLKGLRSHRLKEVHYLLKAATQASCVRENVDKIIGYVHAFELFRRPENLQRVLRPVSLSRRA